MITAQKAAHAWHLVRKGHTWEGIAKRHGCSVTLLRAAAAQASRRKEIKKLVQRERDEMRRLAAEGETPSNIAAAFGMKLASVSAVLGNDKRKANNDHASIRDGMGPAEGLRERENP